MVRTCVGVAVCPTACGVEEVEMVLWSGEEVWEGCSFVVVVGERCGAMAGLNLEARFFFGGKWLDL